MIEIAAIITTVKTLAGAAKAANRVDLYNDVISLQQSVLELVAEQSTTVEENARLKSELLELKEEIRSLESRLAQREEMTFRADAYWQIRNGRPDEGPFCASCFDKDGRVARMTDRGNGFTCCVVCGHCIGRAHVAVPYGAP